MNIVVLFYFQISLKHLYENLGFANMTPVAIINLMFH
jgi:hypothetical protein